MGSYSIQDFQVFFCSHSNFKPIIYCQFTALEFMRSYSQQKFVEESETSKDPMSRFQSMFRVLCYMHSMTKQPEFQINLTIFTQKNLFQI